MVGKNFTRDPLKEIIRYNRHFRKRNNAVLAHKFDKMATGPFPFFRGTYHLFARDLAAGLFKAPDHPVEIGPAPQIRIVGDLHLENFGAFKSEDGELYYNINDFDETTTACLDADLKRCAASVILATRANTFSVAESAGCAQALVDGYVDQMRRFAKHGGEDKFQITLETAQGEIKELLQRADAVKRADFIAGLTQLQNGTRRFKRTIHYLDVDAATYQSVERALATYIKHLPKARRQPPEFYQVEDVAYRIAGNGSLGRNRYAVLLAGKGTKEAKNVILEIKESLASAWDLATRDVEFTPPDRAREEITAVQVLQGRSSRHLGYTHIGKVSYQVRELGPQDQRLDLSKIREPRHFAEIMNCCGLIIAACHVRGNPDGRRRLYGFLEDWSATLQASTVAFALSYAYVAELDHRYFVGHKEDVFRQVVA